MTTITYSMVKLDLLQAPSRIFSGVNPKTRNPPQRTLKSGTLPRAEHEKVKSHADKLSAELINLKREARALTSAFVCT